jgi:hypothetical protein
MEAIRRNDLKMGYRNCKSKRVVKRLNGIYGVFEMRVGWIEAQVRRDGWIVGGFIDN